DFESLERLYAELGLATRLPSAAWRTSVPIYVAGGQAGYATSGAWSPLLKKYIALAHVRARWAAPGTRLEMEVTVEHRRKFVVAHVAKKPFFDRPRKKARRPTTPSSSAAGPTGWPAPRPSRAPGARRWCQRAP